MIAVNIRTHHWYMLHGRISKTFCCKKLKKKPNKKVEAVSFQSCEILKQTNQKQTNKKKPHSDRN